MLLESHVSCINQQNIILICRLPSGTEAPGSFHEVFKLLNTSKALKDGIIHWNFPHLYLSENTAKGRNKIQRRISSRIEKNADLIIPSGFSGTFHPLITNDILSKEIEWAKESPWENGTGEGFESGLFFPASLDFDRKSFRKYYKKSGITWLSEQVNEILIIRGGSVSSLPSINLANISPKKILSALKKKYYLDTGNRRGSIPLVIICNACLPDSLLKIDSLLSNIETLHSRGQRISFCRIPETIETLDFRGEENITCEREEKLPLSPDFRSRLPLLSLCKGKSDAAIREKLKILSPMYRAPASDAVTNAKTRPRQRVLGSNMTGLTQLSDKNITVYFRKGRFSQIQNLKTPVLRDEIVNTYLRVNKKKYFYSKISAASFIGDRTRGLRESLVLKNIPGQKKEGTFIGDYYFTEDYPHLIVSIRIKYPEFDTGQEIGEYSPFEIPVFSLEKGETVSAKALYPGKEICSYSYDPKKTRYVLKGCIFHFRKNNRFFSICFPGKNINLLPISIRKSGKNFCLYISPHGSYNPTPGSKLSRTEEHFSFLLSADVDKEIVFKKMSSLTIREFDGEGG